MKEMKNLATVINLDLNTEGHIADIEVDFGLADIHRLIVAACERLPQRKKVQEDAKEMLKLSARLRNSDPELAVIAKLHCNKEWLKKKGSYSI